MSAIREAVKKNSKPLSAVFGDFTDLICVGGDNAAEAARDDGIE